jgi:high-affinity iron transporter
LSKIAFQWLFLAVFAVAPASGSEEAQRAIHLLDYIAVDYPEAVQGGEVINQLEFEEQIEFLTQVGVLLDALEGDPGRGRLQRLRVAVSSRAPAELVEAAARDLSARIRSHYDVRVSLARAPRPERGATLFARLCASCHGAGGRGDGPAGAGLDPAPSDLGDPKRMLALSPFTVFSTISYGIEGTGMVGYTETLTEGERLDLTFFTAALAHEADVVARGRRIAEGDPRRAAAVAANLDAVFVQVPASLPLGSDERAVLAYLRTTPSALVRGDVPLEIARARLAESVAAHRSGDAELAMRLAVSAYLDGFEHIEPALALVDPGLRAETEAELIAFRGALRENADSDIDAPHRRILALFDRAQTALGQVGLSPGATFLASFAILVREGLEAILLVAATLAIVSRASARDIAARGRRAVHIGWVTALGAGGLTWWAAQNLIAVSGAQREIVEGLSALLAAAVLVWVSYWLFSRLDAAKWQAVLGAHLETAAAKGSLWVLGALAFLAVYREAFETVLFYQALAAQGANRELPALWAGAGSALALLFVAGFAIVRLGRRLPLRQFFATSSVVLYAFAVVFAGHGIAALQEAAALPMTAVAFPRVVWLGIYPTLEGLGLQGLLVLLGLVAVPLSGALRGETDVGP